MVEATRSFPYFPQGVSAGFASPADDYETDNLNLNDYVINNESATFFVRVKGDSMKDANLMDGDILVIDRSLPAIHGKIVIAFYNGDFTVKRLYKKEVLKLIPENKKYPEICIDDVDDFSIWGVVTYIVHKAR